MTVPSVLIRHGELRDLETIALFNLQLAAETEALHLDPQTVTRGVQAALVDSHKGRYLVACCDGKVIGQLMLTWEWSDWRNGTIWWVQSVYVSKPYRQQGVFRQLFSTLKAEAQADPTVVGIRLYVERHNTSAHHVYEQLGMKDSGYEVFEQIFANQQSSHSV